MKLYFKQSSKRLLETSIVNPSKIILEPPFIEHTHKKAVSAGTAGPTG